MRELARDSAIFAELANPHYVKSRSAVKRAYFMFAFAEPLPSETKFLISIRGGFTDRTQAANAGSSHSRLCPDDGIELRSFESPSSHNASTNHPISS